MLTQLQRIKPATVLGLVAVVVAASGTAFAAGQLVSRTSQIKNGIITSAKIKNRTLQVADISARARKILQGSKGSASATYTAAPVILSAPTDVLRIGNTLQGGTGKVTITATSRLTANASINMSELSLATGHVECVLQVDNGAGVFTTISQLAAYKWNAQNAGDSFQVPLTGAAVKAAGTYDVRALCDDPTSNSARFNRGDLTVVASQL